MRQISILVVDDFERWRHFVCSMIGKETNLHVAGEASDGPEAVQKAKALKPDLVLLDIGLPKLNGLVVARRIRRLSPYSKILFLSQESSPDVVREALKVGVGFVVKTDAAKELLSAVNAVMVDRQFLSSRLADTLRDAEEVPCGIGRGGDMKQLSPAKHSKEISTILATSRKTGFSETGSATSAVKSQFPKRRLIRTYRRLRNLLNMS